MKAISVSIKVDVQPERIRELIRIGFDPALHATQHWGEPIKSLPGKDWWEIWVSVPRLIEEAPISFYVLSPDTVEQGLQVMADQSPEYFSNILNEDLNTETADVFLQFCLFGAIVFEERLDIS